MHRPGALLVVLAVGSAAALAVQVCLWFCHEPGHVAPFALLVIGQALLAVTVLVLLRKTLGRLSHARERSTTLARRSQRFKAVLDSEMENAKQTRARLRRSQSDVRTVLGMLPDTLLRVRLGGEVCEYREGSSQLVGFPAVSAGANVACILPARASEPLLDAIERALRTGSSRRLEIAFAPDEELGERTYEIRLVPSGPREVLAVLRDITLSKTVEVRRHQRLEAVTRARDTAQEEARTMAALIEELGRARHAALQSARVKSEFLANMSHEIRTPLNGVIGMTDMLLDTALSTEQQEYAETIHSSSESLLTLLNAILDFSKIEAGAVELERVPFSLRRTLKDTLRLFALRAGRKGLQLISRVRAGVPDELVGDPTRFRQIITNLVENAIKFTQEGRVSVVVEPRAEADAGRVELRVFVRDTGLGISEQAQEQIFNAFTQADSSTTRRFGGTGLGLAISFCLAKLLGGDLSIESALGQGSTFRLRTGFELQEGAAGCFPPLEELSCARVLVASPDTPERRALCEMLEELGAVPVALEDLEELPATPSESAFSLALVDANLPGETSQRFLESLQALDVPALVLLPLLGQDASREGQGARAGLVRPLCELDLRRILRRLLAEPGESRPASGRLERAAPVSQLGSLRVLVAEDNEVNQRLLNRVLEKAGHRVVSVWNGQQAIDACDQEVFDVVLMDVQMPVMSGLEATRWIRAMERDTGRHLQIVAVTAHALAGDAETCLAAGMDAYLSKPVRAQQLLEVLDRLGESGSEEARVESPPQPSAAAPSAIDVQAMLDNVDGDRELLSELAELFIQNSGSLVDGVEVAVQAEDPDALMLAAHKLKGAIGNFQAPFALEAARRLECLGRERTLEEADAALTALRNETKRMLDALRSLTEVA